MLVVVALPADWAELSAVLEEMKGQIDVRAASSTEEAINQVKSVPKARLLVSRMAHEDGNAEQAFVRVKLVARLPREMPACKVQALYSLGGATEAKREFNTLANGWPEPVRANNTEKVKAFIAQLLH